MKRYEFYKSVYKDIRASINERYYINGEAMYEAESKVLDQYSIKERDLYYSIKISQYQRFKRVYNFLSVLNMICENLYFITLTIDNKHIKNKEITFTKKIREQFKIKSPKGFLYNVDYGDKNNRLHYHVIAHSDNIMWPYGFIKSQKINNRFESVAKYIIKLSNHSIKASTQFKRIYIYRRFLDDFMLNNIENIDTIIKKSNNIDADIKRICNKYILKRIYQR